MFNFSKTDKDKKSIILKSPVVGRCFDMSKMPDDLFSNKTLGDGVGFESADGILYAPVDGEILQVFPAKHAIILKTKEGIQILLHIGIDAGLLNGKGFEVFTEKGKQVKLGDKLLTFDNDLLKTKAKSNLSVLIVTNNPLIQSIDTKLGNVNKNNEILEIKINK